MNRNPTPVPPASRSPLSDLSRIGAVFCLVLSLIGIALGAYLTQLKFKMTYTPCLSEYGSCQVGGLSCEDALSSSWSTLLGLPISAWGSAFYLVTAVLAGGLVWRRELFGGTTARLLFVLAVFDVLVSVMLGTYAGLILKSPCPYCLSLYVVSALLLGGAQITRSPPSAEREHPTLRQLRDRLPDLLDAAFLGAVVFIVAVGSQSMAYHGARNGVDSQVGCPEPEEPLPPASIKIGAEDPKVILAVYIDMTCHHCRDEFKRLANALVDGVFPVPVQMRIFHTPRHACDLAAFPAGYQSDDAARFDNACLAARAAECKEKLQPGTGAELLGGLFALQDDREKDVPLFTAERIGNRAADLGMEIDPDDAGNPLFRCIDEDQEILARITAHQRHALGYKVPTVAVYRAADGEPDLSRKPLFGNANTPLPALSNFITVQAGPAPAP